MYDAEGISKKEIQEEYEDLVFRKVMAIYVKKESEQILSETEEEDPKDGGKADAKSIDKLFSKKERRENLKILWKYSKKVINFAAVLVFVAAVSLSSVVMASAQVRDAITDAIYHLVYENNERYTQISIGESTGFIDADVYNWVGAYAPTFVPEGYVFKEKIDIENEKVAIYSNGKDDIVFSQSKETTFDRVDTENAETVSTIIIGDSEGLIVYKDGITTISWNYGDTLLSITGQTDASDLINMANGIKIVK